MTTCKNDCKNYPDCINPKHSSNYDAEMAKCRTVDKFLCFEKRPEPIKCEACEKYHEQWILKSAYGDENVYHVCTRCITDIFNFSLSKTQYQNLLKNGHTSEEYYLHDNFYDDKGIALRSKTNVALRKTRTHR